MILSIVGIVPGTFVWSVGINMGIVGIERRMKQMPRQQLEQVREGMKMSCLSGPLRASLVISYLNDKRFSVRNPISIIVEENDKEAWARWPEANAYGIGLTLYDAIRDLKESIVCEFLDLSDQDKGSLGGLGIYTLGTLRAYIDKVETPNANTGEQGGEEIEDALDQAVCMATFYRLWCKSCGDQIMLSDEAFTKKDLVYAAKKRKWRGLLGEGVVCGRCAIDVG